MEPVGTIAGSSSESYFRFVVQATHLRRGDYVRVSHEDGPILARATAITREKDGLIGTGSVVGSRDARGVLVAPKTPFRPGDRVWLADDKLIGDVLGLGEGGGAAGPEAGAYLGLLKGHGIRVQLDIDLLVQKHVSVMAKTGSGKSYVVGVLIEELLKRQVPVIIVDPHGEYTSLAQPNNSPQEQQAMRRFGVKPRSYADRIMEYSPDTKVNAESQPLRIDGTNLGMHDLTDLLGGKVSSVQLGLLHQAIKDVAARRKKGYNLGDIIHEVNKNESNAKWPLLGALQYLDSLGLFADQATPVQALVKRGQVTVINLRGSPPEVQEIVVAWLGKGLFEARKVNSAPPLMMVVEEAHHFCPERGFTQARSSDILRTIASEGRKFGLGLCVVSQRPAKVDKNVLSQANTQVILKVTNPNDLKAIIASVEGLTRDAEDEIQQLAVGTALISHPRYPMPLEVEIRPRETRHGGKGVSVLDAWGEDAEKEKRAKDGDTAAEPDAEAAGEDEIFPHSDDTGTSDPSDEVSSDPASAVPGLEEPPIGVEADVATPMDLPLEPEPEPAVRFERVERAVPRALPSILRAAPGPEPLAPADSLSGRPMAPAEAPSVIDLRALFQHVLREDLRGAPDDNLREALAILEDKAPTLRGLRTEFPGAAEVDELERLHRAAMTRLRKVLEERRRQRGFLGWRATLRLRSPDR